MKIFIDPEEKFIIKMPDEWYFINSKNNIGVDKQPYGFEPYEERTAAFQISYKESPIINKFNIDPQPKGQYNLSFIEAELDGFKTWVTNVEGGGVILVSYVLFSFTQHI